jgi:hypothetical protein
VVVVPALEVDGRAVRSSQIRTAIADGDLVAAARQLGRPHAVVGEAVAGEGAGEGRALRFALPVALPPDGRYVVQVGRGSPGADVAENERGPVDDGEPGEATVADGVLTVAGPRRSGRTRVAFTARR